MGAIPGTDNLTGANLGETNFTGVKIRGANFMARYLVSLTLTGNS